MYFVISLQTVTSLVRNNLYLNQTNGIKREGKELKTPALNKTKFSNCALLKRAKKYPKFTIFNALQTENRNKFAIGKLTRPFKILQNAILAVD